MPDGHTPIVEAAPAFPPKLAAALCKISASVKQLGKSERNNFAKYDFVSVDKFYAAIGSLMAENGVHCIPDCIESEVVPGLEKTDKNGSVRRGAPLLKERWAFTLLHESGEVAGPYRRSVTVPAEGAQAHGSSESYAQKQFLRGVFRVPTGDKDDPDWQEAQAHRASYDLEPWMKKIAEADSQAALFKIGEQLSDEQMPDGSRRTLQDVWTKRRKELNEVEGEVVQEVDHETA